MAYDPTTTTKAFGFQDGFQTTLGGAITASTTAIPLTLLPTPTEGTLVIEPGTVNEEEIYFTSSGAGVVNVPSAAAGRGVNGTAVSHSSGAIVKMLWTKAGADAIKQGGFPAIKATVSSGSGSVITVNNGGTGLDFEANDNSSNRKYAWDNQFAGGWMFFGTTWTYASASAPEFTFTIVGDFSAVLYAGMKIRLTQTTIKYFIITKVAFSAGTTTVTIYGGTDYTLANAAITLPYYAMVRVPSGFPMSPDKWTAITTDSTERSQSSPVSGTWYNVGGYSLSIPTGVWDVSYNLNVYGSNSTAASVILKTTLSTANNTESDIELSTKHNGYSNNTATSATQARRKFLTLAAATTYYLNSSTTGNGTLFNENSDSKLVIKAVSAYL
jgi:hypothetical protein